MLGRAWKLLTDQAQAPSASEPRAQYLSSTALRRQFTLIFLSLYRSAQFFYHHRFQLFLELFLSVKKQNKTHYSCPCLQ